MAHPSSALKEYLKTLKAAERLARLERRYKDPPNRRSAPTVEALRGGFTVLVVGGFERFLSESIAEHLAALATSPPPLRFVDLPESLRLTSVFEGFDLAIRGPRHQASGSSRKGRFPDVVAASRRVVNETVDVRAVSRTRGNPDAPTVRKLFVGLGVTEVFDDTRPRFDQLWARPESSSFVADKLDEIVGRRHTVAHTANALAIGRRDLGEWGPFLGTLSTVLDERLDRYTANVLNRVTPP